MRVEFRSDGSVDVTVRQSWLSEWRTCPERARRAITTPSSGSDLTMIGTAVHEAAAAYCSFEGNSTFDDLAETAVYALRREVEENPSARWTKFTMETAEAEARNLTRTWWTDLRQFVVEPVGVEQEFLCLFDTMAVGPLFPEVRVWLSGTIDLVQGQSLWDWKTSGKRYSWRDKQAENIQATAYSFAAVSNGWLNYPVEFKFGVLLRGTTNSQVIHLTRDSGHTEWLRRQVQVAVRQRLTMGDTEPWAMIDTGGLCSPDWCDAWSSCKGQLLAHIPYPRKGN